MFSSDRSGFEDIMNQYRFPSSLYFTNRNYYHKGLKTLCSTPITKSEIIKYYLPTDPDHFKFIMYEFHGIFNFYTITKNKIGSAYSGVYHRLLVTDSGYVELSFEGYHEKMLDLTHEIKYGSHVFVDVRTAFEIYSQRLSCYNINDYDPKVSTNNYYMNIYNTYNDINTYPILLHYILESGGILRISNATNMYFSLPQYKYYIKYGNDTLIYIENTKKSFDECHDKLLDVIDHLQV